MLWRKEEMWGVGGSYIVLYFGYFPDVLFYTRYIDQSCSTRTGCLTGIQDEFVQYLG